MSDTDKQESKPDEQHGGQATSQPPAKTSVVRGARPGDAESGEQEHWGRRLARAMDAAGVGPKRLSEETGVGLESIKKYLQCAVDQPRGRAMRDLAEALDVPFLWLRDGIDTPAFELSQKGRVTATAQDGFGEVENLPAPVHEVDVRATAGAGAIVHHESAEHAWGFPEEWLRQTLLAKAVDLRILTVEGDSMLSDPPQPRDIEPGDKVMVNLADRAPTPPGIFILHDGIGLVAKRVEHIDRSDPPALRVLSNNVMYRPYERVLDEVHIVGRVVGRWQRL